MSGYITGMVDHPCGTYACTLIPFSDIDGDIRKGLLQQYLDGVDRLTNWGFPFGVTVLQQAMSS